MAVGVTTWIHGTLLKGVKFNRRWKPGSGRGRSAESALKLGRKVDAHLKAFAVSGTPPPSRTLAGKMCGAAVAELRARSVQLINANVFLKCGPLKTHVDGVGKRGAMTVIVELKTTSRTIDAFTEHYHHRCRTQPKVGPFANTEYTHHMLQLGWTTMAWRETKQRDLVTGMLVVAAADGAATFPLDETYASRQFWRRALAAAPPPTSAVSGVTLTAPIPAAVPLWPGPMAAATLASALGVTAKEVVDGRVQLLSCGGAAVASLKRPEQLTKKTRKLMVEAVRAVGAGTGYYVYPWPGGWRVKPLVLATK